MGGLQRGNGGRCGRVGKVGCHPTGVHEGDDVLRCRLRLATLLGLFGEVLLLGGWTGTICPLRGERIAGGFPPGISTPQDPCSGMAIGPFTGTGCSPLGTFSGGPSGPQPGTLPCRGGERHRLGGQSSADHRLCHLHGIVLARLGVWRSDSAARRRAWHWPSETTAEPSWIGHMVGWARCARRPMWRVRCHWRSAPGGPLPCPPSGLGGAEGRADHPLAIGGGHVYFHGNAMGSGSAEGCPMGPLIPLWFEAADRNNPGALSLDAGFRSVGLVSVSAPKSHIALPSQS